MTARHVACVAEGGYVRHAAAMLHSLLTHSPRGSVHVHYVHGDDLRRRDRAALERWLGGQGAAATFHRIPDERCAGLPTEGFTGRATWYRIFLPELLPDAERALFLDADAIVCDDLAELWATDLEGAYVAAVTNVLPPEYSDRPAALGLPSAGAYFNAGVLLLNLELMRRDGCTAAMHRFGVDHAAELVLRDQDALNAVLAHRRRPLHPRWNAMNFFRLPEAAAVFAPEALAEARRRPAIRHFEGPDDNKPWHRACRWEDRELYFAHRAQTPWPRVRREGPRAARLRRLARRLSA